MQRIMQHEFWPGPLRPTRLRRAIVSTRCLGVIRGHHGIERRCGQRTINGDFLCYGCKDPEGYAARLREAQKDARQRCLEAYPVCQRCGMLLSQAQVNAGQTRHELRSNGDCWRPGVDEPLAQRQP